MPSKSEKKRQAAAILEVVEELAALPPALIADLPADTEIRALVLEVRDLRGGARKRLLKFIAKRLRAADPAPLLDFLAERRGSLLKDKERFHRLERLRDDLVREAIAAMEEETGDDWPSPALDAIGQTFPSVDTQELRRLAARYARSRKKAHSRQIFRLLQAAEERLRLQHFSEEGS